MVRINICIISYRSVYTRTAYFIAQESDAGIDAIFKTTTDQINNLKLRNSKVIHTFAALNLNAVFSKMVYFSDTQQIYFF